jgi:hypothetical protein
LRTSPALFAVPRYLEFVHELPTTESGKVQKYKLGERGVAERTWDREASHEGPCDTQATLQCVRVYSSSPSRRCTPISLRPIP